MEIPRPRDSQAQTLEYKPMHMHLKCGNLHHFWLWSFQTVTISQTVNECCQLVCSFIWDDLVYVNLHRGNIIISFMPWRYYCMPMIGPTSMFVLEFAPSCNMRCCLGLHEKRYRVLARDSHVACNQGHKLRSATTSHVSHGVCHLGHLGNLQKHQKPSQAHH